MYISTDTVYNTTYNIQNTTYNMPIKNQPISPEREADGVPPFVGVFPRLEKKFRDDVFLYEQFQVCMACCCFHISCMPTSWECVGCAGRSECICCVQECCCTMDTEPFLCCDIPEDQCCRIGIFCYGFSLKKCPPTTCCKNHIQLCPCVFAGAFPTDDDIPCVCTVCCCTVYPDVGWGYKVRDLNGSMVQYADKSRVYVHPQKHQLQKPPPPPPPTQRK